MLLIINLYQRGNICNGGNEAAEICGGWTERYILGRKLVRMPHSSCHYTAEMVADSARKTWHELFVTL